MKFIASTRKLGDSLVVDIPISLAESEGIRENQLVRIQVEKIRMTGFGFYPKLHSFDSNDKFKGQLEKRQFNNC